MGLEMWEMGELLGIQRCTNGDSLSKYFKGEFWKCLKHLIARELDVEFQQNLRENFNRVFCNP